MEKTIVYGVTGNGGSTLPTLWGLRPRATSAFESERVGAHGSADGTFEPSPQFDPIQDLALVRTP